MNLSADEIRTLTGLADVTVLDEVNSTNSLLKTIADAKDEGAVQIARKQTAGRGRCGRTFISPLGGLYLSVLLKPRDPAVLGHLTMMAGVAAAEAIEENSDQEAQIKWVNDIFVNGKKVCGLLAENHTGQSTVILGAGFNLLAPEGGYDKNAAPLAGAVFEREPVNASCVAASFLNRLFSFYRQERPFFEAYKARCFLLGKTVSFMQNGRAFSGRAEDICSDGTLLVRTNGRTIALSGGEVSLTAYPGMV